MNNDITVNSVAFSLASAGTRASGSVRKSTSPGGAQRPTYISVKHQDYVDSTTKVAGRRSVVRYDQTVINADGKSAVVSAYLVVAQPTGFLDDTVAVETAVQDGVTALCHMVGEATQTSALDLKGEIFILEQQ